MTQPLRIGRGHIQSLQLFLKLGRPNKAEPVVLVTKTRSRQPDQPILFSPLQQRDPPLSPLSTSRPRVHMSQGKTGDSMCARRSFPEADAATELGCEVFMGVNACDRDRGRSRPGQEKLTCDASASGAVSCPVWCPHRVRWLACIPNLAWPMSLSPRCPAK